MRLFSAIWPSEAAVAHLTRAFGRVALPTGVKPVPPPSWHLTLGFYGNDADPAERAAYLDQRLAGLPAPRLRLAGAGTFPGVLWVGVDPIAAIDREALRALAVASGANRKFTAHLTVARWRLNLPVPDPGMAEQLGGYRGPTWTADRVVLAVSEQARGGAHYAAAHAVPLHPGRPDHAGETGW